METWVFILAVAALLLLYPVYGTDLRKIPGPFLASVSDLWRFFIVWKNEMPHRSLKLHRKYGPLVRIGPRYVSASSSEAIHTVYRAGTGFAKSEVYGLLQPQLDGSDLHNLFSTQDKTFHATLKRNLGALYSQKAVEGREPNIEKAISILVDRLRSLSAKTGSATIDMSAWMHFWAFEAMSHVNFSRPYGFLAAGRDVGDVCSMSHDNMKYFGLMGQMPTLERMWSKCMGIAGTRKPDPLFGWVMGLVEERESLPKASNDVLDSFLALHQEKPTHFTRRDVIAATYISVVTAHDVLAITLRAIVYYLVKNPRVLDKFRAEISAAEKDGKLSEFVKFSETADLDYVNAVIIEVLRIHPSTGLIFERYVPEGGIELHGSYLPEGTTIGVNAWVFNRDKALYGEDSDEFRPERWIDSDPAQLKEMRKWLFTFSAGARACIGRHLAMAEMTKLTIDLFRRFDLSFTEPDRDWNFDGNWLTTQGSIEMIVKPIH